MSPFWKVLLLSMTPISELRGSIPLGVKLGLSPLESTLISLVGNILIIPVLLLIMQPIFKYLKTLSFLKGWIEKYENRAAKKVKNYRKYRFFGVLILVGIPIPTTGVYTGVLASQLLNMRPKVAFAANALGVCMSATIVFLLTTGVLHLL